MTSPARTGSRRPRRAVLGAGAAAFGLAATAILTGAFTGAANAATPATTSTAAWPTPTTSKPVPATIEVSGAYDGKTQRFYGSGDLGDGGQNENQSPLFQLKDGAVLSNVVIGAPAADGIHCLGTCTLKNVWWEDVGEDAATFKGKSSSAVYRVEGGGARKASDKVFQFNGAGTLTVTGGFQVVDFGKLVRSCGNCSTQYRRKVVVDNVDATAPGKALVGINSNYGDSATLRGVRVHGDSGKKIKPCVRYEGNNTGAEPKVLGSGPDGTYCRYSASDITYS
ncbi:MULTISPECIES: pectate lyase [unclassified Streptomyces]|uniref:pectate lyase n=1 Tax=unclassified Streptomyces TaxID=2593676 RepID=UPI0033FA0838